MFKDVDEFYTDINGKFAIIYSKKKMCENINNFFDYYQQENTMLRKRIKELENGEAYKKLQEQFKDFQEKAIIVLGSDKELEKYKEYCKKYGYKNVLIRQEGNGIGVCTYLSHNDKDGCYNGGEETDITDIEVW